MKILFATQQPDAALVRRFFMSGDEEGEYSQMDQTFMKERAVLPLVLSMALPMMLSMVVLSLYNIVDSYFVAQISEDAMTALSLVFPVQNFIGAITIGFGVGINAAVAFQLGAEDFERADAAATQGVVLSAVHGVLLTVVCIAAMPSFLGMFTDDAEVVSLGLRYSNIAFAFSLVIALGLAYEKIFQSVGRMASTMFCMMCGCVANIILDPIMIFGFGPVPAMGIEGAAWATGIGQTLTLAVGLRLSENGETLWNNERLSYEYPEDEESQEEILVTEQLSVQETRTFTVVGFYERPGFEELDAPGYTLLTGYEEGSGSESIYFTLKKAKTVFDFMEDFEYGKNPQCEAIYNTGYLRAIGVMKDDNIKTVLYGFAAILIGIVMLVVGYNYYGRFVERILGPDDRPTPAYAKQDGVDYVPMRCWKNSLINLLNIAGTGPILGPIQGILFGPIAFITIPIGNIIGVEMVDYFF